jgi:hypothetical protein
VSNRSRANGGGRHRCAQRPSHSFNAMAIGGAGIILAAPAAAAVLLAAPGQAQEAPPAPRPHRSATLRPRRHRSSAASSPQPAHAALAEAAGLNEAPKPQRLSIFRFTTDQRASMESP